MRCILAGCFVLVLSVPVWAHDIYDFGSLEFGNLEGQDGWGNIGGVTSSVSSGTGVNTTNVIEGDGTRGTVDSCHHVRANDANWIFVLFSGIETAAYIKFDCIVPQSGEIYGVGFSFRVRSDTSSPHVWMGDDFENTWDDPRWGVRIPEVGFPLVSKVSLLKHLPNCRSVGANISFV